MAAPLTSAPQPLVYSRPVSPTLLANDPFGDLFPGLVTSENPHASCIVPSWGPSGPSFGSFDPNDGIGVSSSPAPHPSAFDGWWGGSAGPDVFDDVLWGSPTSDGFKAAQCPVLTPGADAPKADTLVRVVVWDDEKPARPHITSSPGGQLAIGDFEKTFDLCYALSPPADVSNISYNGRYRQAQKIEKKDTCARKTPRQRRKELVLRRKAAARALARKLQRQAEDDFAWCAEVGEFYGQAYYDYIAANDRDTAIKNLKQMLSGAPCDLMLLHDDGRPHLMALQPFQPGILPAHKVLQNPVHPQMGNICLNSTPCEATFDATSSLRVGGVPHMVALGHCWIPHEVYTHVQFVKDSFTRGKRMIMNVATRFEQGTHRIFLCKNVPASSDEVFRQELRLHKGYYTIKIGEFVSGQAVDAGFYTLIIAKATRAVPVVENDSPQCVAFCSAANVQSQMGNAYLNAALGIAAYIGVRRLCKNVGGALNGIKQTVTDVSQALLQRAEHVQHSVDGVAHHVHARLQDLNGLDSQIDRYLDKLIKSSGLGHIKEFAKFVPCLVLALVLWQQGAGLPVVLSVLAIGCSFNKRVRGFVVGLWKAAMSGVRAQGDDPSSVGNLLAVTLLAAGVGQEKGKRHASSMLKSIGELPRLGQGIETLVNTTMAWCEKAINWMMDRFGRERVNLIHSGAEEVDQWLKHVAKISTEHATGKLGTSYDDVQYFVRIRKQAQKLMVRHKDPRISAAVTSGLKLLAPVQVKFAAHLTKDDAWKPEPPCVFFHGPAGTGKSVMITFIASAFAEAALSARDKQMLNEEPNMLLYQKGTSQYWEGYCGQVVFVIDDFGTSRLVSEDDDVTTLMKAVNSWKYPLNFAALENKGTMNFSSKVVLCTSNHEDVNAFEKDHIFFTSALERRIGVAYMVHLKPAFRCPKGRLVPPSPTDNFEDVWEFEAWDMKLGVGRGLPRIGMSQVVKNLVDHYRTNLAKFENMRRCVMMNLDEVAAFAQASEEENYDELFDEPIQVPHTPETKMVYQTMWGEIKSFVCDMSNSPIFLLSAALGALGLYATFVVLKAIVSGVLGILPFGKRNDGPTVTPLSFVPGSYVPHGEYDADVAENRDTAVGARGSKPGKHVTTSGRAWKGFIKPHHPCDEQVRDAIQSNLYRITTKDQHGWRFAGNSLMLVGKVMLMPAHYYKRWRASTEVQVIRFENVANSQLSFDIERQRFFELDSTLDPHRDMCAFVCPVAFAARDAIKKFVTQGDLRGVHSATGFLQVHRLDDKLKPVQHTYAIQAFTRQSAVKVEDQQLGGYVITDVLQYTAETKQGDCGGLVYYNNKPGQQARQCIGMHLAGDSSSSVGFACVLDQEYLRELVASLSPVVEEVVPQDGIQYTEVIEETPGASLSVCTIDHKLNRSSKTKLVKLHTYECLGSIGMQPALLYDKGPLKPMQMALAPYVTMKPVLEQTKIDDAMRVVMQPLYQLSHGSPRAILDFDTAVLGDPDDQFMRSIPRSTSAGYPYNVKSSNAKKKTIFGDDAEYDLSSVACSELRGCVQSVIDDAKLGKRQLHVFSPALKDELRKDAKVLSGATRLISGAPLVYLVAFRMYFMSFMSACMRFRIDSGLAVGINPHSAEWDVLVRRLRKKGSRVVAGDYKGFDAVGHPQIFWSILRYINQWYADGPENARIREVLWMELVNSRHIYSDGQLAGSLVYQWHSSLPSGHPFTALGNSFGNLCLLAMAFCDATGDMYSFWTFVQPIVFGDDNVIAVSEAVLHVYNQHTLPALLAPYGFVYTDEAKTGDECQPHRDISEVSFLKRGFRYDDVLQLWVAPLDRRSMLKSIYWCANARLSDDIELQAVQTFIAERAVHGRDGYHDDVNKVLESLRKNRAADGLFTPPYDCEYLSALKSSRNLEY